MPRKRDLPKRKVVRWPRRLVVYQCPDHKSFTPLCIETEHGGHRLLGGKCCIRMYERAIASWPLTLEDRDKIVIALQYCTAADGIAPKSRYRAAEGGEHGR